MPPDRFECPECGAMVKVGRLACPECGSDAQTGWKDEEEIQYASVEIPDYLDESLLHAKPTSKSWVWWTAWVALIAFVLGLVLWVV